MKDSVGFIISVPVIVLFASLVKCGRSVSNNEGIPIEPIPGTNLLTGVYYRISVPRRKFAVLTWADVKTGDGLGKYAQIDDHIDRTQFYAKGGKWYKDGLWVMRNFGDEGYVTIRNAAIPWSGLLVASPKYLKPEDAAPEQNYIYASIGLRGMGEWEYALWKITPALQQGKYILQNKAIPSFAISSPRYGEFYRYMIPDTNVSNWQNYGINGTRRSKVLFQFDPMTAEL